MNTGIKDGKLVIDMAEADALWNSMTMEQQYNAMRFMFDPILAKATKMQRALQSILEAAENQDADACHELARAALEDRAE
jgi:DNA-binding GntR family transcriptional regulator